ncbi:MAG: histidinol-phosphate transaminase [Thermodesulfobacteriota bacterium]
MTLPVPAHIRSLVPYPPGKPMEELERELGITGVVKLASNENALGPSPKALAAIAAALPGLHRYPDGSGFYLKKALAERLGVEATEIVLGNGSNELIELLAEIFLAPGDEAILSHPTFLVYQKMIQARGGCAKVVPLQDFGHDLAAIAGQVTARTRMIFLDNPNNPAGTVFGQAAFRDFLAQLPAHLLVVLDEAYVDFVSPELAWDSVAYRLAQPPVAILRTFSKAYGLAGLRIGYGVMAPEVSDLANRIRQPFNVNTLAQIGALAALADREHLAATLAMTREGIARLAAGVAALGCRPYPSQTNFFLVDLGRPAKPVYEAMLHRGVIVRPMAAYDLPSFLRITPGTPAENERCLAALAAALDPARP